MYKGFEKAKLNDLILDTAHASHANLHQLALEIGGFATWPSSKIDLFERHSAFPA